MKLCSLALSEYGRPFFGPPFDVSIRPKADEQSFADSISLDLPLSSAALAPQRKMTAATTASSTTTGSLETIFNTTKNHGLHDSSSTTRILTSNNGREMSSTTTLNSYEDKPHLDIVIWLKTMQLYEQYGKLFEKFSGVEEIIHYTGRELSELGVKNGVHRSTLQSGLAVLREKYKNAVMRKNSSTVTSALVAFYEGNKKADTVTTASNTTTGRNRTGGGMDGNMNRIEHSPSTPDMLRMVVNSDEENYINHRLQLSPGSRKLSSLNGVNNNIISTSTESTTNGDGADDIRGHLWYHGSIGRSQAEALVAASDDGDGDSGQFLVRDCISRAGNYVLTCKWKGAILHFMINRTVLNTSLDSIYEKVVYHFEDDHYRSVPDLIRAYVGQRKPITDESACVISKPINRSPQASLEGNPLFSSTSAAINLKHTVSEKSVLYPESKSSSLRIVDEDREQGNYVRMREPKSIPTSTATNRGSISANGIANLKIPQVPASIRNRPLPPVPTMTSSSASSSPSKALTLRSRVMLKEARRHQLNKWRSESALEDSSTISTSRTTSADGSDGEPTTTSINPAADTTTTGAINGENLLLHSSTSLQALNKEMDNGESNNHHHRGGASSGSISSAPAKPRRAPSLKKGCGGETPRLVIRDAKTGQFREIEEGETADYVEEVEEDEDYGDYHEYCDIDYEQLPPSEGRSSSKNPRPREDDSDSRTTMVTSPKKVSTTPPALPPRPKLNPLLGQDRDSACVADMVVYDRPSSLCKPYSPKLDSTISIDHYDVLKKKPTIDHYDVIGAKVSSTTTNDRPAEDHYDTLGSKSSSIPSSHQQQSIVVDHYDVLHKSPPVRISSSSSLPSRLKLDTFKSSLLPSDSKPLDARVWPKMRSLLLSIDAQSLASAITKSDLSYLNLLDDEKLTDYDDVVINHALPSLILLPMGEQYRTDVQERNECWRFFVESTLLQKESERGDRTRLLAKWIDTARLLAEKFGNEFGFCNIMHALVTPQIASLTALWRQLDTDSPIQADAFSAFLKPRFLALQRSRDSPGFAELCVPDLDPMIRLYGAVSIDQVRLFDWEEEEETTDDDPFGLDSFWHRLQSARRWPSKANQWRLNFYSQVHSMIDENQSIEAESICQTEFHLRYLFGTRGSTVSARERYTTFRRILAVMALNASAAD